MRVKVDLKMTNRRIQEKIEIRQRLCKEECIREKKQKKKKKEIRKRQETGEK